MDDQIISYAIKIVVAIVIFIIGKKIATWITEAALKAIAKNEKVDDTLNKFLSSVIYSGLLVFVVLFALSTVGIEITSIAAILGAVGIAIALAFQNTLSSVSAGVMIMIFKPILVGEYVEAGGTSGVVEKITIFYTIMRTGDNKMIIVSNSNIMGSNITNYSRKDTRRVDITFGIGYDDDLKLAKNTLKEILNSDPRVLKDPEAFVAVSELADSSVNFITRSWVKSEDYWGVYHDTLEKVKLTFDEKNISIPYPQMDLHTNN